ncbi:MAG: hypothetical protein ACYTGQ_20345 [Planctomycetota bacterium]|jgi:hypothetical protein
MRCRKPLPNWLSWAIVTGALIACVFALIVIVESFDRPGVF